MDKWNMILGLLAILNGLLMLGFLFMGKQGTNFMGISSESAFGGISVVLGIILIVVSFKKGPQSKQ